MSHHTRTHSIIAACTSIRKLGHWEGLSHAPLPPVTDSVTPTGRPLIIFTSLTQLNICCSSASQSSLMSGSP